MKRVLIGVSGVLLVSVPAMGAPFRVNVIDAGGVPGSLGAPIRWTHPTNGAAYNNASVAGNGPPTPELWDALPAVQHDSFIALDTYGPGTPAGPIEPVVPQFPVGPGLYIGLSPTDSNAFRASGGNGSLIGVWFNTFDVPSCSGWLAAGQDSVFIAQITLRPGSSFPETAGVMVNIKDSRPGQDPNGVLGAVRFGEANSSNNGGLWAQNYYLTVRARTTLGVNTAFNGGTTYEVYLVSLPVPGPGGAALAAALGLVSLRRRRG